MLSACAAPTTGNVVEPLPTPSLPLAISQVMSGGALPIFRSSRRLAFGRILTPDSAILSSDDCVIKIVDESVLVTVQSVPLHEEGIYRFQIALTSQPPVFVDVPVLSVAERPVALPIEAHLTPALSGFR